MTQARIMLPGREHVALTPSVPQTGDTATLVALLSPLPAPFFPYLSLAGLRLEKQTLSHQGAQTIDP